MSETIKKRISDLDAASQPLGGTELAEISQGGVSKKVTLTNIFGSGWWAALRAAFSAFVAPEATHAVDSDTVGGESASDLHDAAQLTGAVPLASIPAELTGKNAATATLATNALDSAKVGGIDPVNGNAGTYYKSGSLSPGSTFIIPKGTYIFVCPGSAYNDGMVLQIQKESIGFWEPEPTAAPMVNGMVISDGVNFRLINATSSSAVYAYRKLA